MLTDLWRHRAFITNLVRRDFQIPTARAAWGSAWLVIQPTAQILIFTVVFAGVLRAKLPGATDSFSYGFYVCSGIITWNYFSELITRGQTLFLEHADLLKSMNFPHATLPAAMLLRAIVNFLIVAGVFLLVLAVLGRWPGWPLLAGIPLFLLLTMLGLGLGILTGTLNVFFRDVGQAMNIVLQFWFWLTPIVYPLSIIPEFVREIMAWNPLLHVIGGYQQIVVARAAPDWSALLPIFGLVLALDLAAWAVFRSLSQDVAEAL